MTNWMKYSEFKAQCPDCGAIEPRPLEAIIPVMPSGQESWRVFPKHACDHGPDKQRKPLGIRVVTDSKGAIVDERLVYGRLDPMRREA